MAMSPELEKRYRDRFYAAALASAKAGKAGGDGGTDVWTEADQSQFDSSWEGNATDLKSAKAYGSSMSSSYRDLTTVFDDDPAASAFKSKFGDSKFEDVEWDDKKLEGLQFSYEKPTLYGAKFEEWAQDPSRIMQLDDGRWVWEQGNLKGDWLVGAQKADADSGLFKGDKWDAVKVVAFFAAAYAVAPYLAGEAAIGAGTAEAAGGAELLGGTGGVTESAYMGEGLLAGGEGAGATAAGTGLTEGVTPGLDVPGPLETPVSTVPADIPPVQPTTVPNLPPATPVAPPVGWTQAAWNALGPTGQKIVLQGLGTGASAVLNDRNATRAIDAANKRQEDDQDFKRRERERRGQVGAVANVRPRTTPGGFAASGGLTDKYMNRNRGG